MSWNFQTPLDDFAAAVDAASDLGGPVSQRGLFVVYYDTNLRRWTQNELENCDERRNDLLLVEPWMRAGLCR